MSDFTSGLLLIAIGILAMLGAVLNWRIVTHSGKLFNILFGDKVARSIYFIVGAAMFVLGVGELIGANWLP